MGKRTRLPRIVIDTNLFISGTIVKGGTPFQLLEAWRNGFCSLLVSDYQRDELHRVLQRPAIREKYALTSEEIKILFRLLDTAAKNVPQRRRLPIAVRDPKDEMILSSALEGKADYLVSGDEDLLSLRADSRIGTLKVVTAREFLDTLNKPPN